MQINVRELFTAEGKSKDCAVDIDMDFLSVGQNRYPLIRKEGAAVTLTNLGNRKIALSGKVSVALIIPCDRCLKPVEQSFSLLFERELDFGTPASGEEARMLAEEQPYVSGFDLDADQLIAEELVLNLPMKVLCREDCRGICNRCGADLNLGSCSCSQSTPDPRMAVIQDIFQKYKEV